MATYCDFSGSYYDQAPWTHAPCMAETQVPEGCPVHFVTGAPVAPDFIEAYIAGSGSQTPNTATVIGSDDRTFLLPDEFSCDCAPGLVAISFQHFEVALPDVHAGDHVRLMGVGYETGPLEIDITAAGACPTVEWPTDYSVALACDRCPVDPNNDSDGDGIPDNVDTHDDRDDVGCSVGGDPSVILAAFALVPLLRRRRAKIHSSE